MPQSNRRGIPVTLWTSATTTGSSGNSGNLKDTTKWIPAAEVATIILDVTALAGSGALLDVNLQTSPDGGTTWYISAHFAQISTSTAVRFMEIHLNGLGMNEVGSEASHLSTVTTAITSNTVIPSDVRISWVGSGTVFTSSTFAIHAYFAPQGTRGG